MLPVDCKNIIFTVPQEKTFVIDRLTIGRIKFTTGQIHSFSGIKKKSKLQLSYEGEFPEFETKRVHWEDDQVELGLYPTFAQTSALKKLFDKGKMFNVYIFFKGNKKTKTKRKRIKMSAILMELEMPVLDFENDRPELIVKFLPQNIHIK